MSIESVMPSNCLIHYCPLLLLPSIFPTMSLFQWVRSSYQVAKVLELQLQHQSFQRIFRVNFLRIDWFDLLAFQEFSRVSSSTTVWRHLFFMLSLFYCPVFVPVHDYWKNHRLWTFLDKVMSLLFNMLSVIDFLRRSKHLLISWLQSPLAVLLESKKI